MAADSNFKRAIISISYDAKTRWSYRGTEENKNANLSLIHTEMIAVQTHSAQQAVHIGEKKRIVNRNRELDVTHVSGAIHSSHVASTTPTKLH